MLHSPTMPRCRIDSDGDARAACGTRSFVSVWLGATTMLSPVWIPSGSKFSMLQTVMQLSYAVAHDLVFDLFPARRDTPRPAPAATAARACWPARSQLVLVRAEARAQAAQREAGAHHDGIADLVGGRARPPRSTSRPRCAAPRRRSRPACSTNSSRSSVSRIACDGVPSTRTPYFSSTPGCVTAPGRSSAPSGRRSRAGSRRASPSR